MRSNIIIGLVLALCVLGVCVLGQFYRELLTVYEQAGTLTDSEYSWVFRLLLNLLGYSTVLLPCYVLYKYLERTNYFDKITNQSWVSRVLFACFSEHERLPEAAKPAEESPQREGLELVFCFTGLMAAYLVWGLLQEKIMTQKYAMADGSLVRFNDSQFLVFINRLLGFALALARLLASRQAVVAAPLYKFSYCSLTNIISAWCQYEALKYVSFPTQVLSKSCKVIPVMLMGKLVSRNKYEPYEYGTALLISVGMMLFMFGSHDQPAAWGGTSLSGVCLLALYMWCDSFTSSWQGALFRRHALRPLQMLCAVNLCSCALTAAALRPSTTPRLLQHPMFVTDCALLSISSALGQLLIYRTIARFGPVVFTIIMTLRQVPATFQHPMFVTDCALLSISSALGQLLIYRTIARFGPVVFTIIMTLRQAVSILLSCAVYGHAVSAPGALGVALVFGAVLLRVRCRTRTPKPALAAPA